MGTVLVPFGIGHFIVRLSPGKVTRVDEELEIVTFLTLFRYFIVIHFVISTTKRDQRLPQMLGRIVSALLFPNMMSDFLVSHFGHFILSHQPTSLVKVEVLLIASWPDEIRMNKVKQRKFIGTDILAYTLDKHFIDTDTTVMLGELE